MTDIDGARDLKRHQSRILQLKSQADDRLGINMGSIQLFGPGRSYEEYLKKVQRMCGKGGDG